MHVLRNLVKAVEPGGVILDLQVIRPHPVVEVEGQPLFEIDGAPLFATADTAAAAIDELVGAGTLLDEAVDDHDVREHYRDGADLVEAFVDKRQRLPDHAIPELRDVTVGCAVRSRCRLRRLRVV